MNFSRGLFLTILIENMLQNFSQHNLLKKKYVLELDYAIKKIELNGSGCWKITSSDQAFLHLAKKLRQMLLLNNDISQYRRILQESKKCTSPKVRVLFLTQEVSCWPSIESVFYAAVKDERFEADLVYLPFLHENFNSAVDDYESYQQGLKLPIIRYQNYNLAQRSPDIVFMLKPYATIPMEFNVRNIELVVPRIVYVPYGMEITTDLIKFGYQYYLHYRAWRHCAYGPIVKHYAALYGYRNADNIAIWGHPKADHYRCAKSCVCKLPKQWQEKIHDRKVILWTPHHLIDPNDGGTGTWLVWKDSILKQMRLHLDVVFIWRPHPLLLGTLVNGGYMTQEGLNNLVNEIKNMENVIYDSSTDYRIAFDAADAIITDGTTFSIEFLYTGRPILLTPRNIDNFYISVAMQESYYIVNSEQDIENFISMVACGQDPLHDKRLKLRQEVFYLPEDKTVGQNIVDHIYEDLLSEIEREGDVTDVYD